MDRDGLTEDLYKDSGYKSGIQSSSVAEKSSLTPWSANGDAIDYDKLIKEYGTQKLDDRLFSRLRGSMPPPVSRGMCYSHRDLNKWLDAYDRGERVSVVTGRGPSERMHIGHLTLYAIAKYFQDAYGSVVYIPVSDDEKFYVKDHLSMGQVDGYANDNILDILAMGFDPKKTVVFKDFDNMGSIYRYAAQVAKNITYSTAKAVFGLKPENNLGWTFYPAIQAMHILYPQFKEGPHHTLIPIGIDQDPFMRITRDVSPKFDFVKPAAIHKKLAPGLSGPKMSSSEGGNNAIWLDDDEKAVAKKINKYAFSGGRDSVEEHRRLGGRPEIDSSFQYLKFFFEENDKKLSEIESKYRSGEMLSGEMKHYAIEKINSYLSEHRKRKENVAKILDKFMLR